GVKNKLQNWVSRPRKNPILIFGFPKSGTSVIAALIAHRANKSVTLDTKNLCEPYISKIKSGELDLKSHINQYSYPFSKDIIKEPNFVFIVDEILKVYSEPQVVVTQREKLTNIKSILDRLGVSGDLTENPSRFEVNRNWHSLLF